MERALGAQMSGPRHEQDDERPHMLALGLRIVLCDSVEGGVARSQQLADVARQELHLLGDGSQRVNRHGVVGRSLRNVAHHVGGHLDGGSPCRVSVRAGVQRGLLCAQDPQARARDDGSLAEKAGRCSHSAGDCIAQRRRSSCTELHLRTDRVVAIERGGRCWQVLIADDSHCVSQRFRR